MDSKYVVPTRRGLASRKTLIILAVLCTLLFWMAGSRRVAPLQDAASKFEGLNTVATLKVPETPKVAEAGIATPTPPAPAPTPYQSLRFKKHFWGVPETSEHLRGEGVRNRTQIGIEKASLVMLVRCVSEMSNYVVKADKAGRNREQKDALIAMKNIEERFNQYYRYPWTFLNDEDFTEDFKLQTSRIASGEVQYGLIPHEHWSIPDFIDDAKFRQKLQEFEDKKIIYGGSESYRHSESIS
jgi:hypothetical protein